MCAIYNIENEYLMLAVCSHGAEMRSLILKATGKEQLWQRDPAVWENCAPWLFPMIGMLKGGCYTWQGKPYAMPMHGFALEKEFTLTYRSPSVLRFTLQADADTLTRYPWQFQLEISYTLAGPCLNIQCRVTHHQEGDMYFSLGAHPGFLCEAGDRLIFSTPEEPMLSRRLDLSTHLLRPGKELVSDASGEMILRESLFAADAVLLERPLSQGVRLLRKDHSGVDFHFGAVPWLGVWSRAAEPLRYVCIEPWYGVDDPMGFSGDLPCKPGIQCLPQGEAFTWKMTIKPFSRDERGKMA